MNAFLTLLALEGVGLTAGHAGLTVDRVLARVNGDPIMMSQLAEFMMAARPDASLSKEEAHHRLFG